MAKSFNSSILWLTTTKTKQKVNRNTKSLCYLSLYRYATPLDYILITIALVASVIEAVLNSFYILAYGDFVAMLVDRSFGLGASSKTIILPLFGGGKFLVNATHEENMTDLRKDSWAFGTVMIIIALKALITGTIAVDLMNVAGLRMLSKLRQAFFEASIRKDIGWHDERTNQNFALHMTESMEKIRCAISENVTTFTFLVLGMVISILIAFIVGPKLASLVIVFLIIIIFGNIFSTMFQKKYVKLEQSAYIKGGNLAEEIFSAIRTVVAFCGENLEARNYDELLDSARKAGKLRSYFSGFGYAMPRFMLFILIPSITWYGASLLFQERDKVDREYTPAVIIIVYQGIVFASKAAQTFASSLECFVSGVAAARPIFEVIDSAAKIDPLSSEGKFLKSKLNGDIEFRDVFFKYPSRNEDSVLRGLNLKIQKGQTVAFVGHSGSGKSTCLQLLQRFYDPAFGDITVDDVDIRQYNVSYLRSNIATVGQEPVLFQGTIGENIKHGKPEATQRDIEIASQSAGAHDFISKLPQGYDTLIAEKGIELSGGQKQRIAIARALISNPTILLLDEATSALDYQSEKAVQEALDKARQGRTTIVVSHRLSAIKNADRIFFLHDGKILEEGSHDELVNLHGRYFEMIKSHIIREDDAKERDAEQKEDFGEISLEVKSDNLDKHWSDFSVTVKNMDDGGTRNDRIQYINTFVRILQLGKENWGQLTFVFICAAIYGCAQAAVSLIIGEYYEALTETDAQAALRRLSRSTIICGVIAVILGIASYAEGCFLNIAGINLTTKLKSMTFKTIISQEIGWFDDKQNSVGVLSAHLSGDTAGVQHVIGYPLSGIVNATANLIAGVCIAFYFSWQIALVYICSAPLMMGPVVFEALYLGRRKTVESKIIQKLSQLGTEAVANIRTVASLRRERQMIVDYNKEIENYTKELRISLRYRGVVYASQFSIMYLAFGVGLSFGGVLCSDGVIGYSNITRVSAVLQNGLIPLALTLALCSSLISGLIAAGRIFCIIDRKPQVYSALSSDKPLQMEKSLNAVKYQNVSFHYPSRPDVRILNSINFEVLQGKTVALVGPSGCGKSTCFELLLRFYDLCQGEISLEGKNIHRDVTLTTLRSKVGIVSQEPTLFRKSIAENIAYGDNSRKVTMTEIIEAAKLANAYEFIIALPNGFETILGARGTQLSGGQKQRIAIARALIKNPKVLLLDEATSALDFLSERIVQSVLDRAVSGRTCIVIAHRLDTIQNADLICVVQDGLIVEQGKHLQLLKSNGLYTQLYKSQSVDR